MSRTHSSVNWKNWSRQERMATWSGGSAHGESCATSAVAAADSRIRRWIKFEEDVEEGGDRWSKPHVATISLHSLFELRSCLLSGTVMLDLEASSLAQIADLVLENMVNAALLQLELRDRVKENLLRRHRHQHEKRHDKNHDKNRLPNIRSLVDIGRNSSRSMFGSHSKLHALFPGCTQGEESDDECRAHARF